MDGAVIMIPGTRLTMAVTTEDITPIMAGVATEVIPITEDHTGRDITMGITMATGTASITEDAGMCSMAGWTAGTPTAIHGLPMWCMGVLKDPAPMTPGTAAGPDPAALPQG